MFVDVPGFDNPPRSDWDTLQTIANWLEEKYRADIALSGIIYMHRITDRWLSGPVRRNLDIFARLCGDKAAFGMRLVTTMWDEVKDRALAENSVWQLEANFWRPLIDAGARHRRFEGNSSRCAWGIIDDLTGGGEVLLIQEELVDVPRKLHETAAGKALHLQFQKFLLDQEERIKQLQEEAKAQRDPGLVRRLEAEQQRLEAGLQKTSDGLNKLRIRLFRHIPLLFGKNTYPNSAITMKFEDDSIAANDYVIL
ncbi:hypothetical protein EDD16DRAFT_261503 [Pisolithus croceorrhizus]|nr:hypothetical protein EDD16DRAFT_261503 [Pisolithus croceorrhizus]